MTDRDIDTAMAADRPEKVYMRELWAEYVAEAREADAEGELPWYLTLPGAHARDIICLAEKGLIARTETGAIAEGDAGKITAIESNRKAQDSVRDIIPGVQTASLSSLLKGSSSLVFPGKKERRGFRARVVNLDFNGSLILNKQLTGDQLIWVEKITQMHSEDGPFNWVLCLTLSARMNWDEDVCEAVSQWLADNFVNHDEFRTRAEALLGAEFVNDIVSGTAVKFGGLPAAMRQRVLMTVVPKSLIQRHTPKGWRIAVEHSLCYGNDETTHPMVSFVFRFQFDDEIFKRPTAAYAAGMKVAVSETRELLEDGSSRDL